MKFFRKLLWPFGLLYGSGIRLRNFAYDRGWLKSQKVPVPVISVGNISTGGTGKTPMAEFLLQFFSNAGLKAGYLSRGYGRKTAGYRFVTPAKGSTADFGDEARQVAAKFPDCPVAVCENRYEGALRMIKDHAPQILVLDDAFQHRAIDRDFDLVMIDLNHPPHTDLMLPAGNRREPLSSLRRAHFLVGGKREASVFPAQLARPAFPPHGIANAKPLDAVAFDGKQKLGVESLQGREVVAFSGLGNNLHFRRTLESLGLTVRHFFSFRDHRPYKAADLAEILTKFDGLFPGRDAENGPLILTTEKDFWRMRGSLDLKEMMQKPTFYLRIALQWDAGEDTFKQELQKALDQYGLKL